MATLDYSLQLAEKGVEEYQTHDRAMAQHKAIMGQCDECEKLLQLGIDASRWLKQADEMLREAAKQGIDVSEECVASLEYLCRGWLEPCPHAEELVERQKAAGYPPENLDAFRQAREEVEKWVRFLDMDKALDDACQGVPFDAAFWAGVEENTQGS